MPTIAAIYLIVNERRFNAFLWLFWIQNQTRNLRIVQYTINYIVKPNTLHGYWFWFNFYHLFLYCNISIYKFASKSPNTNTHTHTHIWHMLSIRFVRIIPFFIYWLLLVKPAALQANPTTIQYKNFAFISKKIFCSESPPQKQNTNYSFKGSRDQGLNARRTRFVEMTLSVSLCLSLYQNKIAPFTWIPIPSYTPTKKVHSSAEDKN